ncbi:alanine and glycine-rich protein-like [Schistocerca serialis cubense]|uniref:alanine and glycine-rich protein-like n=1 Tax=Schistocerca serialis cubense TaxID=2023355 RepID=UPI00214F1410|nr:alanine and glycine-rich protein-like [Schistocerca serialis cubense]
MDTVWSGGHRCAAGRGPGMSAKTGGGGEGADRGNHRLAKKRRPAGRGMRESNGRSGGSRALVGAAAAAAAGGPRNSVISRLDSVRIPAGPVRRQLRAAGVGGGGGGGGGGADCSADRCHSADAAPRASPCRTPPLHSITDTSA